MRIFCIFLVLLSYYKAYALDQISGRSLKFDSSDNDYLERLDVLEKENQNLLGRIEMIEHNISTLERVINSSKHDNSVLSNTTSEKSLGDDAHVGDIFEIPSAKQEDQKNTINNDSNKSSKNIDKDKQSYDLALADLKDNKLVEAEEKFAKFLNNYPKSSLLSNAYFWYAESFFRRNIFDKSAINYLKGYKQSPKGAKAADSLLKLALSLGEIKKKQEACAILNKLESEFPSRSSASIKRAKDAKIKYGCK